MYRNSVPMKATVSARTHGKKMTRPSAATSSNATYERSATSQFEPVDSSTGVRNPLVIASPAMNSDRCRTASVTSAAVTTIIATNAAPSPISEYVCDAAQMER